ncbi:MAG: hypothetical protein WED05_10050 [Candidatus Atabeyarchaeum deiterrae]
MKFYQGVSVIGIVAGLIGLIGFVALPSAVDAVVIVMAGLIGIDVGLAVMYHFLPKHEAWKISIDLEKKLVSPELCLVKEQAIDDRTRVFRAKDGTPVYVLDKSGALTNVHRVGELEYLADVGVMGDIIKSNEKLVVRSMSLEKYAGVYARLCASRVADFVVSNLRPAESSDNIRGMLKGFEGKLTEVFEGVRRELGEGESDTAKGGKQNTSQKVSKS